MPASLCLDEGVKDGIKARLSILLVEDNIADARLIIRELSKEGFDFSLARVDNEDEFRHALESNPPDLVLSSDRLAKLDGFRSLSIAHECCPGVPFVFISSSNDQQMICNMFDEGVDDYVFKRDLRDLQSAISRLCGVNPDPAGHLSLQSPVEEETEVSSFDSSLGCLHLCPECHQARDESGQLVSMEDYCFHRMESLIVRRLCTDCTKQKIANNQDPLSVNSYSSMHQASTSFSVAFPNPVESPF